MKPAGRPYAVTTIDVRATPRGCPACEGAARSSVELAYPLWMRHVVTLIVLSLLSLGCSQPPAEPTVQPEPIIAEREPEPTQPEPTQPEPATQLQQPSQPFIPHDERDPAETDLATPPALPSVETPRQTRLQPGVGRCRVDEDCVLTSFHDGCCAPGCAPYATNKQDLAAREARKNCDAYRSGDKVCPPPAPCPPSTTHARAATCVRNTCTAVLELLTD